MKNIKRNNMEFMDVNWVDPEGNKQEFQAEVHHQLGGRTIIWLRSKNAILGVRRNVITENFIDNKDEYLGYLIQDLLKIKKRVV